MKTRQVMLVAAMLVGASVLSACAIAAKVDARQHYQESLANYRSCLAANPSNVKLCEAQRLTMEVDERAFNNMSAGMTPGANTTSNVIVQGR